MNVDNYIEDLLTRGRLSIFSV